MSSQNTPPSQLPASLGPGGRPLQPGESPGTIVKEISEIRSHYTVHLESEAVTLGYDMKGQVRSFRLPFDSIPMSGLSKSVCFGGPSGARITGTLVIDVLRGTENLIGRPVTQREAEGFTLHASKRMMYQYAGSFTSIAAGYALAWRGRKDMKFPFRAAKSQERYLNFPNRYLPILKGQYARIMWQITRANIYAFLGILFINPFFRSMGDTAMTVGLYRDDRTQEVMKTMKGGVDRIKSNRANAAGPKVENVSKSQDSDSSNAEDFYGNSSSYGNKTDYASDSSFTDGTTDTGLLEDSAMSQRETKQASPNAWSRSKPRDVQGTSSQEKDSGSSGFFFDEASPTAGNYSDMDASEPSDASKAWANVRRQRVTTSSMQKSRDQSSRSNMEARRSQDQNLENSGDSFSFSKSDEDKQLAKDQAQKEFDAMLERERRESGSGEYTRGSAAAESGQENLNSSSGDAWSRWRKK